MAFTGFNVKYPEYECICPQSHLSFTVRSLSVSEEERLKSSFMSQNKINEHLNKCIYESLIKKPKSIKEYDDFISQVTVKDRESLLYALYHITYEEVRNYDVTCSACRKENSVTINASDSFSINPYPKDNIIGELVSVDLTKTPGVKVFLKQPSLKDESVAYNELGNSPAYNMETISETLIIDKFVQEQNDTKKSIVYEDRIDVIDAYMSLPAKDKRDIHKQYYENFGKYGIELKMRVNCSHCPNSEVVDIDLVDNFFRMVYTS